jgi:hypothetical protein
MNFVDIGKGIKDYLKDLGFKIKKRVATDWRSISNPFKNHFRVVFLLLSMS